MEVGSVHSLIERKLKNTPIFSPIEYLTIFRTSRASPRPYEVKSLNRCLFQNYGQVSTFKTIRPGRQKDDPTVNDLKCLKYSPDGELSYKLTFDEDWKCLPKARGQKPTSVHPTLLHTSQL
ncbi:hypothetical protein PoB_002079100 [Plakobranchus ocellatus]|uniref:Uncharacterized protein n=1 Tax=Plakobranchus ocellatus TaxID=259542 RepID=A0AAV3ZI28_9GAST|nr:hypothetical protein PoB_002079100 [Plakobranchus ocellatus]